MSEKYHLDVEKSAVVVQGDNTKVYLPNNGTQQATQPTIDLTRITVRIFSSSFPTQEIPGDRKEWVKHVAGLGILVANNMILTSR